MWNSSLQDAYHVLGVGNGALSADEDVGVAYYKERPLAGGPSIYRRDALEFIAEARRVSLSPFPGDYRRASERKECCGTGKEDVRCVTRARKRGWEI